MMDPDMLAIMIFFLLAIIISGCFVLMMPLSRQLAKFLELRIQGNAGMTDAVRVELRQLRALVEGIDDKLSSVSERQEFLEKVLESRDADQPRLPR
jgi:hypothetical protein